MQPGSLELRVPHFTVSSTSTALLGMSTEITQPSWLLLWNGWHFIHLALLEIQSQTTIKPAAIAILGRTDTNACSVTKQVVDWSVARYRVFNTDIVVKIADSEEIVPFTG